MKKGKRLLAAALAAMMVCSMAGCGKQNDTEDTSEGGSTEANGNAGLENMIQNGDFSDGLTNWMIYLNGADATQTVTAEGEMEIAVSDPGTLDYAVQPYYDGFSLDMGCVYEFSFDVHATIERTMEWRLQLNGGDYHAYVSDLITVNEEVQHVIASFTMEEASDPAPRLCVNMGMSEGSPEDMGAHSVYFDNFALYLTDDSGKAASGSDAEIPAINVNQVGYLPNAEKKAVVRAELGTDISGSFDVVNVETDAVVLTGELEPAKENAASGEQTAIADFSEVTDAGTYKLVAEGFGESFEFRISDDVYEELADSTMRMFYLQRCGEAVTDDVFGHEACHTGEAEIYGENGSTVTVTGGWHDAGDYGRYTVAAAKAAADLMLAYEVYGDQFGDDAGIPESGNGIPDVLDEVKYELDWMLQMQDSATGGVYHKITCENFPGSVMPEEETEQLVLAPISTTATADFAAAMAMAARVFKEFDADYSQTCLAAAEQAEVYLDQTPSDKTGFRNPSSIATGEYGDTQDMDERYWALAELYKTTGDSKYSDALRADYTVEDIGGDLGWQSVGMYGIYAYLTTPEARAMSDNYLPELEEHFYQMADEAMKYTEEDAYGVAIGEDDYCWGSNMVVANKGMLLLMANQLSQDEKYRRAAGRQLDYLLGTNTNSYCFVTGFGTLSPEDPHHRPSEAVGEAMGGMLVGGPNSDLEDPYAAATLSDKPNAACYADNVQSYSCNEITIYWNSPLVYLLAGMEGK